MPDLEPGAQILGEGIPRDAFDDAPPRDGTTVEIVDAFFGRTRHPGLAYHSLKRRPAPTPPWLHSRISPSP